MKPIEFGRNKAWAILFDANYKKVLEANWYTGATVGILTAKAVKVPVQLFDKIVGL